jgi:uncharacterized membrane-anchored protein YhcB (DUF1043 family)
MILPIEFLIITIVAGLGIFLGILVYRSNPKNPRNRYFIYVEIGIISTIIFAFVSEFFPYSRPDLAILFSKLTYSFAIFFALFFFLFSATFLGKIRLSEKIKKLLFLLHLIFALFILFSSYIVEDIEVTHFGFNIKYGPLANLFFIYMFSFAIPSAINFITAFLNKDSSKEDLLQIKYIATGFLIFIGMELFFSYLLPHVFHIGEEAILYRFGNYSAIIFITFTAYGIITKQIFETKAILTEILVLTIGLILFILPFLIPGFALKSLTVIVFLLFLIFGYLLIRYTHQEIHQKEILEEKVKERTKELEKAYQQLEKAKEELEKAYNQVLIEKDKFERLYKATLGREMRIIELKEEVKEKEERIRELEEKLKEKF